MKELTLTEWWGENIPNDQMLWKTSLEHQIGVIKSIPLILYSAEQADSKYIFKKYLEYGDSVTVINTHTSKSILCPVYKIVWRGITFILRNNFYNWKISVDSLFDIKVDFENIFEDSSIHRVYCEGFSSKDVFGSYSSNNKQFTVELYDAYDVHFFFRKIWYFVKLKDLESTPIHIVIDKIIKSIPDDILQKKTMYATFVDDLNALSRESIKSGSPIQKWGRLSTILSLALRYSKDIDPELTKKIFHIAFNEQTDIDTYFKEKNQCS